ncbi:MAG: hypothetical protein KDD38_08140 [Bdellovibrionales bacterium]|nr:hypothetical protein [Bdellovibrionales bacterium]
MVLIFRMLGLVVGLRLRICSIFLSLFFQSFAHADRLSETERQITHGIQSLSTRLDGFFSHEDLDVEDTGSRLKMGYAAYYEEYKDPSYNFLVGFRLVLPRTQKKLQLLVIGDEEDLYERKDGESSTPDKNVSDSVKNQKISVGLRSLFHKSKESALVFDMGVKIKNPLDPFARISGRRSFFYEDYELRFLERLYWFESIQWGSSTSIDLDRPFAPGWLGRFSNNGVVDFQNGLWELDHYLALYHLVSERTALGYRAGVTADDEKSLRLQSYYISFNYRFALIKPWLYLEATPKLTWPREQNWIDVPSIYVKIESIYGL